MDLDDELRRLFRDERLDIQVKPGADQAVVTGARKARRKRVVLAGAGGTFAVAALVAGSIALAGIGGGVSMEPAGPVLTTTTGSSPTEPESQPKLPPVSAGGQVGYGKLQLGMSEADALATGLLTPGPDDSTGCHTYSTGTQPQTPGAVIISPAKGILRITLPDYAKTTMGISVGSTAAEVKMRYPAADEYDEGFSYLNTSPFPWYYQFIIANGRNPHADGDQVTLVRMQLTSIDCSSA
ncbi:hypothetical protein [Umezawaea sp. Da 62-37]|uniref:hypothetical protein n=1 Tax=Umezawaea sp. Da 62-37 TaxID=3075927 RepID=UPI0028F6CA96|nr:hypothetical protein [Umezawaea sp. Da 62-37]WNV91524.1 hypothetical protein RM788_25680 [Umezawaea sp. Da 62-37]